MKVTATCIHLNPAIHAVHGTQTMLIRAVRVVGYTLSDPTIEMKEKY